MQKRRQDVVLTLKQDNALGVITIHDWQGAKPIIAKLLGYSVQELGMISFERLITNKVRTDLFDYIDFDMQGDNAVDVLNRMAYFALKAKDGTHVPFGIKAAQGVNEGAIEYFSILLSAKNQFASLSHRLQEISADEQWIDAIAMAGREPTLHKLQAVIDAVDHGLDAVASVISLQQFDRIEHAFGRELTFGMLQEISIRSQQSLRQTDMIGYLGEGYILLILPGTLLRDANIPLSRIRSYLMTKPMFAGGNDRMRCIVSVAVKQIERSDSAMMLGSLLEQAATEMEATSQDYIELDA